MEWFESHVNYMTSLVLYLFMPMLMAGDNCPDRSATKQAYFGDTHVHTHFSLDASLMGTKTGPKEAYQFAKGEKISPFGPTGPSLQLDRPLDFVAVTDHAELLGEKRICTTPSEKGYRSLSCWMFRNFPNISFLTLNMPLSQPAIFGRVHRSFFCGWRGKRCRIAAEIPWQKIQQNAHDAYQPCKFTSFVGYEWSASPGTKNLHRNVIFKTAEVPKLPTSFFEAPFPHLLWDRLEDTCKKQQGCESLTIPHNSNISNGKMFLPYRPPKKAEQKDKLVRYALRRAMHEPLIEVFQHKGDSECGPTSPDELCQFEKIPYNNLIGDRYWGLLTGQPNPNDFVREALKEGMLYQEGIGVNPYRYGIIASSDTHIGAPGAVQEDNFQNHGGASVHHKDSPLGDDPSYNPGGLAVVWAEQNTREAIFDAMKRRETYGTSGPRINLRFFAAESFSKDICDQENRIQMAYHNGQPMGGEMHALNSIQFYLEAKADPTGDRLMRGQIIKGWLEDGKPKEKVLDVFNFSTGVDHFCGTYTDVEHNSTVQAFYYARVLEVPTMRWTERKCRIANIDCTKKPPKGYETCCNQKHPKTIQERAWSSPIWHLPVKR